MGPEEWAGLGQTGRGCPEGRSRAFWEPDQVSKGTSREQASTAQVLGEELIRRRGGAVA